MLVAVRATVQLVPWLAAAVGLLVATRHHHPAPPMPVLAAVVPAETALHRYLILLRLEGKRRGTIDTYRRDLWAWVGWLARDRGRAWAEATCDDAVDYLARKATTGRRAGRLLADNTRSNCAHLLCAFYRWATETGLLERDPLAGLPVPRGGRARPRTLDLGQLRQVLLAAEADPRLYLMCWLCYGQGLRAMEVAGLRVEDIDFGKDREDKDEEDDDRPRHYGVIFIADGKGGKQRTVPLYPEVRAALVRWIAAEDLAGGGWLFPSHWRPGRPLTAHRVAQVISRHIQSLGIAESSHVLRHAWAQGLLAGAGEEHLLTIARLGGWAGTATLERTYALGYRGRGVEVILALPDPTADGNEGG